jgi:hypothetical protein
MTTTYLRFPDESTGMAALDAAGLTTTNEDGDTVVLTASHTHALDVIGPIYKGGTFDSKTGKVITPPVLLDGWHVNFVGELPDGWEEYLVTPQHPVRVWA